MAALERRRWVPEESEAFVQSVARETAAADANAIERELLRLVDENGTIHDRDCVNLNPATNVMNPRAEALQARGLGRPSLGYPGAKYEMGLEAIERIEVIAAELAAETFGARFAEIRVGSGVLANLYVFMAVAKPGDAIIAPPATIGGHISHHLSGVAGRYGIVTHEAPIDPESYSVDVDRLRALAKKCRPKLITVGGSLNLFPHPLREIREIADDVGAYVLYDAAHLSGLIAGGAWQQPLDEGAHAMTMSAYKSLGGPASGLIVSNEPEIAERLDRIAYPGMTANFDAGKSAALAMTLLDWKVHGGDYAKAMVETARALAESLGGEGVDVFASKRGATRSHQFALEAAAYGGGQHGARHLRRCNILTCGIGLPGPKVEGDVNGLRIGTPEIVRWGMGNADMPLLAKLIARALSTRESLDSVARDVTQFRRHFNRLHFMR
ncbi:MAG TPA: aminotransferase class I/II-fold pyridoxal phosphate-dependent enzyme [Alphaproteobacteria bacterium]|nr:aminotransferase class I/II-fold pyridoxal phosphate-dependent enzyme [Alphaproteobacteria bacterium]